MTAAASTALAQGPLASNDLPRGSVGIPTTVVGRVQRTTDTKSSPVFRSQWPAVYYKARFRGKAVILKFGASDAHWVVDIDGKRPISLIKPKQQFYLIDGLPNRLHTITVQVVSESAAPSGAFGGIYTAQGSKALQAGQRARQIEFIGDSFTVGYGNTSSTRKCSNDDVWATTNASLGFGPRVAQALSAEYQVNAASGRGVVRNFNGFPGDTLPQMYPYLLFDKQQRYQDPAWKPQIIVINLGTNDFFTPLNPGEKWTTPEALRADFETTFANFISDVRSHNPRAYLVLWGTDLGNHDVMDAEVGVVERLQRAGERRIAFVPVQGLSFAACNSHPNVADDARIADVLLRYFASHPEIAGQGN